MDMKKGLLMFALIMISVFLGSFLGELARTVPAIELLGREYTVGFSTTELDLHLCVLTIGFQIKVCICEILLILISLLCYNKLVKLVIG